MEASSSFSDLLSNVTNLHHFEETQNSSLHHNNNNNEDDNDNNNNGDNSRCTTNFTSTPSPKRSRRAIQKKVVNIPIRDLEGSKFKSDCTPPSDSWAWRKYGQKPIKGSPYPRGYYRCSSSKGCPARKQVEKSRIDPSTLVVTYSYDHNHPWPPTTSRNHHHNRAATTAATTKITIDTASQLITPRIIIDTTVQFTPQNNNNNNNNINHSNNINNVDDDHLHPPLLAPPMDELSWLCSNDDHEILQNDFVFKNSPNFGDLDMAKLFPMREEEDELLFADLGELPECPVVFRKAAAPEDKPTHNLASWCGST